MALTRIGIEEGIAKAASVREDLFHNGESLDCNILAHKLHDTYIPRLRHMKLIKAGFKSLARHSQNHDNLFRTLF
jgi:hypothetical protein